MLLEVDRQALEKAMEEFDRTCRPTAQWNGWELKGSQRYAIDRNGMLYPPKKVVSIATGVPVSHFSGGHQTNSCLENRGFKIIHLSQLGHTERTELPVFQLRRAYQRKTEITGRFGGSGQSGIAPSANAPAVFIFTGEAGEQFGYNDKVDADGILYYTGEGQRGDMKMERGNAAIANHAVDGRALHVFRATGKGLPCIYLGEFCYGSHTVEQGQDKDGKVRDIIVFRLLPVASTLSVEATDLPEPGEGGLEPSPDQVSVAELRRKALEAVAERSLCKHPKESLRSIYHRSSAVKDYVLKRADGICELCQQAAPFMSRSRGVPYLEPHHINRLSDGGLDHPRYVAAICPNCHRRVHCGVDGAELNDKLRAHIAYVEDGMEE